MAFELFLKLLSRLLRPVLSIGRTKFYRMIKNGEIPQPIKVSDKEVFWHESSVKKVVEKHKDNSDMIAC
ncbi:AlpA family phage regulatory protein [Acinetobacter baumannii]|uniref:helix-turn-helix transcriptional regulator n=1 Tax=Acinetobacter baumannii TaxID=470 RepID=UPI001FF5F337|nr:AlpA family phage regulatory protein [Acinetobacter baumannii]MCJ9094117.1 AlpA family phage regulatory protein [Acinetobacter baumannii]MCJ9152418.1 AlpA family phage regulatory protein [Acinetobacter baumannii]MCJ9491880.1 AlpA family phage regulatory protein [Acinetobacter baumannii]